MKKTLRKMPLVYPLPITLLGVKADEKIYYTTVSYISILGDAPPLIGVMLEEKNAITKHIGLDSLFSINYPSTTLIDKADLCANISAEDFDKSTLFNTKYLLETPYIDDCPAALIVEVNEIKTFKKRVLIIGEVRRTLIEESLMMEKNVPSMNILDPIIYGQDNMYYQIGKVIGKVEVEGENLYKSIRKTMPPKPYSFHFKLKICELKEEGKSYRYLANKYDVYHETIEDWYALYTLFGREGLTKKMAHKLASTEYTSEEKRVIADLIIHQSLTYREACKQYMVSLSRLNNWVKKRRREL